MTIESDGMKLKDIPNLLHKYLECHVDTHREMERIIFAAINVVEAASALSDVLGDRVHLPLKANESYWHCKLIKHSNN